MFRGLSDVCHQEVELNRLAGQWMIQVDFYVVRLHIEDAQHEHAAVFLFGFEVVSLFDIGWKFVSIELDDLVRVAMTERLVGLESNRLALSNM